MSWTDERVEQLKKNWKAGLTASQIAGEIGGITRNAVIGKLHRLGLSHTGRSSTNARAVVRKRARRTSLEVRAKSPTVRDKIKQAGGVEAWIEMHMKGDHKSKPLPSMPDDVPPEQRKRLADLENHECHWPIGDPKHADFGYCGCKKVIRTSYCATHVARAYNLDRPAPRTSAWSDRASKAGSITASTARKLIGA